ncbi:MAG TPA: sulfotransferase [Acidimicrobiales bacterium]|jgi:hypothetical protein
MALPTFLIIGAARSATTSLHYYLHAHPQITMSTVKEPNYFVFDQRDGVAQPLVVPDPRLLAKSVADLDDYERLFDTTPETVAIGEASPLYFYVRETPELITAALDEPKLIVVLRDPIARAWSHYSMVHAGEAGDLAPGFRATVEAELTQRAYSPYATGTHFLRLGRYGEQMQRYLDHVPSDRILVVSFDQLTADPAAVVAQVCEFLGIDDLAQQDHFVAYNGSRSDHHVIVRTLRRGVRRVQPWLKGALPASVVAPLARLRARVSKPGGPAALPDDLQAELVAYYHDDLELLQRLTDIDLTAWPSWNAAATL